MILAVGLKASSFVTITTERAHNLTPRWRNEEKKTKGGSGEGGRDGLDVHRTLPPFLALSPPSLKRVRRGEGQKPMQQLVHYSAFRTIKRQQYSSVVWKGEWPWQSFIFSSGKARFKLFLPFKWKMTGFALRNKSRLTSSCERSCYLLKVSETHLYVGLLCL